ncbi:MAG: hypothetical protein HY880_08385 [Deltaproteobacteria bacterium]|nr:hypothetical protein [Deltaproteobacteria bacterium]
MRERYTVKGHLAKNGETRKQDHPWRQGDVLLRSAETCKECLEQFKSLYPLLRCDDHDGLEKF